MADDVREITGSRSFRVTTPRDFLYKLTAAPALLAEGTYLGMRNAQEQSVGVRDG
jgi:hypothetical protein